jgi:hypothetical protein
MKRRRKPSRSEAWKRRAKPQSRRELLKGLGRVVTYVVVAEVTRSVVRPHLQRWMAPPGVRPLVATIDAAVSFEEALSIQVIRGGKVVETLKAC